ncbi:hypothetical protein LWI29_005795 [Acer saccharum]|uniref:Uncharacterized protein n=1 Tax=Acer saccharum TaxID=4024 RepID=A0AA39RYG0_ACESA|nr:hypothetical protein LWI29_005795 [Acer saccharum]
MENLRWLTDSWSSLGLSKDRMSSLSILISCSLTLLVKVPCTTNAFLHLDTPAVEDESRIHYQSCYRAIAPP